MNGRLKPYIPELTIRDYNTYLWYQRGIQRQMYLSYGLYACRLVRHNGVLAAIMSDSLAGRAGTCQTKRLPGTLLWKPLMCQTQGIRLAAQIEILMGWHNLQDRRYGELRPTKRFMRAADKVLLRRAYERAVRENPSLERLFVQEQAQAEAQMQTNTKNYAVAAEPMSNVYGAIYSTFAGDDDAQRRSLRYIGGCVGRAFYLMDKAERVEADLQNGRYNVFIVNGLIKPQEALESARRQSLAVANDLVRVYSMLDIKLNRSLLDNIMILGLRHAVYPLEQGETVEHWELP